MPSLVDAAARQVMGRAVDCVARGRRAAQAATTAGAAALGLAISTAHAGADVECRLADGARHRIDSEVVARFPSSASECSDAGHKEGARPRASVAVATPSVFDEFIIVLAQPSAQRVVQRASASAAGPMPALHGPLGAIVRGAAERHALDARLLQAVMQVESGYDARARSPKGARGLMQLMPATAARFGAASADELDDPARNVDVGARYLRALDRLFDGRLDLVLAAYNAGEGAVLRYGLSVPPYPETQAYVRKVTGLLGVAGP